LEDQEGKEMIIFGLILRKEVVRMGSGWNQLKIMTMVDFGIGISGV